MMTTISPVYKLINQVVIVAAAEAIWGNQPDQPASPSNNGRGGAAHFIHALSMSAGGGKGDTIFP